MAEAGLIMDQRNNEALELLVTKCLYNGGFPAEAKYYRVDEKNSQVTRVWIGAERARFT
jgi:hypothetical protein